MILPCLSRLLSRLPSVRNIFLPLRKNNERILTKFAGGKQHHEQVKLFWAKLEQEHGSRIQEKNQRTFCARFRIRESRANCCGKLL